MVQNILKGRSFYDLDRCEEAAYDHYIDQSTSVELLETFPIEACNEFIAWRASTEAWWLRKLEWTGYGDL